MKPLSKFAPIVLGAIIGTGVFGAAIPAIAHSVTASTDSPTSRLNLDPVATVEAAQLGPGTPEEGPVAAEEQPEISSEDSATASINLVVFDGTPPLPDFSYLPKRIENALARAGRILIEQNPKYSHCTIPSTTGDWWDYKCMCKGGDGRGSELTAALLMDMAVWIQYGWNDIVGTSRLPPCPRIRL